jgi:hypothetical protein
MGASGGPYKTISIAGREFRCTGECKIDFKGGGFSTERRSNGDKSSRTILTPELWMATGCVIEIDEDNEDWEFLMDVKNSGEDVDIVLTSCDDISHQGDGGFEGDVTKVKADAAAKFDLSGPGELDRL